MNRLLLIIFFSIASMEPFDGYTLFTPSTHDEEVITTLLMNNDYETIHSWSHDRPPASMPYLFPDGSIIYPYTVESPTMTAGGVGGGIQKISWDGTVLWDYVFADSIYQHHHDVEPLPNGNVLVLVWEKKSMLEAYNMGRYDIADWSFDEMWSSAVLELDPLIGEIVWEWHLWDHLVQDVDDSLPNFGQIWDHPELFDINCGMVGNSAGGPQIANGDWIHMNAIDYNPNLDQIVLSSRLQSEIYIIDHSTTTQEAASHIGGNSGMGGDILYRWGNPQNYGRGDDSDKILSSQHSVNWIPNGYPGEGNLILFNNFHEPNQSSIIEFITPVDNDGNYTIVGNNAFGPLDLDWQFNCSIVVPMQGGSFRLPNGNTIITLTHVGKIIEVDTLGNTVWQYTHSGNSDNYWIARSDKYSMDYLDNTTTLGDVNLDGLLNILDIVIMINMILDNEYLTIADVNEDGTLDILDVVIMANILLGGLP